MIRKETRPLEKKNNTKNSKKNNKCTKVTTELNINSGTVKTNSVIVVSYNLSFNLALLFN